MTYAEKLKDPRWQKKRLEILQRDNFKCTRCECTTKTLQIHHFCYVKGGNPWDSPNDDMTTLCSDCHEISHANLTDLERHLFDYITVLHYTTGQNNQNRFIVDMVLYHLKK